MRVEEACRLSPDGVAETRARIRTRDDRVIAVSLFAKFNEVQGKYTVSQYFNRKCIETFREFRDPHRTDQWKPSRRSSQNGVRRGSLGMDPCLYMLIAKNRYQFTLGVSENFYMRLYQLRLMYGEFDLESSCTVIGREDHLVRLENHLQFIFEEYRAARPTPLDDEEKNWFELDCFWYAKNEVRRLNNFREEKIYRIREGIDLNACIVDESLLSIENPDC